MEAIKPKIRGSPDSILPYTLLQQIRKYKGKFPAMEGKTLKSHLTML